MNVDLVELDQISIILDHTEVLSEVSFTAEPGQIHGILGPNGAGKTMTNKALSLLMKVENGTIKWDDKTVNPYKNKEDQIAHIRKIGYMSQNPVFLTKSLKENIELPLIIQNIPRQTRQKIIDEKIKEFNMTHLIEKIPAKMSIGQQQKSALLRSVIHDPKILILDEPSSSIDMANTKWIEKYIQNQVIDRELFVFWTTHDQFQAKRVSDQVHVIIDGVLRESGTVDHIYNSPEDVLVKKYVNGKLL